MVKRWRWPRRKARGGRVPMPTVRDGSFLIPLSPGKHSMDEGLTWHEYGGCYWCAMIERVPQWQTEALNSPT